MGFQQDGVNDPIDDGVLYSDLPGQVITCSTRRLDPGRIYHSPLHSNARYDQTALPAGKFFYPGVAGVTATVTPLWPIPMKDLPC